MHPPTKASGGDAPPQQAQPVPDDASVSGCLCPRLLIQHFVIQHFLSHLHCFRWKRKITALQLFQFSIGGCGATYFWAHYCICTLYSRRGVPGYTRYLVATTLQTLKQHNRRTTSHRRAPGTRLAGAHRRVAAAAARARLRGRRRPRALRRRLHELRADLALRALLLEVVPARRTQPCDQARVRVWE